MQSRRSRARTAALTSATAETATLSNRCASKIAAASGLALGRGGAQPLDLAAGVGDRLDQPAPLGGGRSGRPGVEDAERGGEPPYRADPYAGGRRPRFAGGSRLRGHGVGRLPLPVLVEAAGREGEHVVDR